MGVEQIYFINFVGVASIDFHRQRFASAQSFGVFAHSYYYYICWFIINTEYKGVFGGKKYAVLATEETTSALNTYMYAKYRSHILQYTELEMSSFYEK